MIIWLISLILLTAVVLFITEVIPLDLTAIGLLVVLMLTGILTPQEAFASLSNPSVITIACMFILSRGLVRTGALEFISEQMIRYSKGEEKRALTICMMATAAASALIGHTPVVVLLVPVVMSICCKYGFSPSKFLIPISYSSIAGGTITLIGTSTHLVVSDLSAKYGYGAIRMFQLSPVGIPVTMLCIALLYLGARRIMPDEKAPVCELTGKDVPLYLAELTVPPGSKLIREDPIAFFAGRYPTVEIIELIRGDAVHHPDRERLSVFLSDILFLKASANDLVTILKKRLLKLPHGVAESEFEPFGGNSLIVELVVTPQSRFVDEHPTRSRLRNEFGMQIIAVKRRGTHFSEQELGPLRLTVGDVLLIHSSSERLDEIRRSQDFIILEDVHHGIINRRNAPLALAIFVGMLAASTPNLLDISEAALTAAFLMLVSGCLRLRDAYRSLNVRVLLTIVGMIALGTAMQKTGAAGAYAEMFLAPFRGQHPAVVLSGFILLTCILTELTGHITSTVILLPVALSTAISIGVNPKPFIIGVCFGASCGFASPISYHTHLLVYGPGGYRFSDFLKMGIPLDFFTWMLISLLIPLLWRF